MAATSLLLQGSICHSDALMGPKGWKQPHRSSLHRACVPCRDKAGVRDIPKGADGDGTVGPCAGGSDAKQGSFGSSCRAGLQDSSCPIVSSCLLEKPAYNPAQHQEQLFPHRVGLEINWWRTPINFPSKSSFGDGVLLRSCFWGEEGTFGIIAVYQSRYGAWAPVGKGRNTPEQPIPFPQYKLGAEALPVSPQ